jgi:phospholipase/lecithinase/hemolysin
MSSLSQLFVFGDSLSDTGNSKAVSNDATFGTVTFPPFPYFEGRFSNGLVAVEYLWQAFNPTNPGFAPSKAGGTNYAIGGATTGNENFVSVWPVVDENLRLAYSNLGNAWQLNAFSASSPSFDPDSSLFLVWLFPNDVFYANNTMPPGGVGSFSGSEGAPLTGPPETFGSQIVTTAVTNVIGSIQQLAAAGARHFLVANAPDLGQIPEFIDDSEPLRQALSNLSQGFNLQLNLQLNALGANRPDLSLTSFDFEELFREVRADPAAFGFSNVSDGCVLVLACVTDPTAQSRYLFWDGSHPTTAGHALIGRRMYEAVHVPVPGPLPALGVALALGWSRRLRRRLRDADHSLV